MTIVVKKPAMRPKKPKTIKIEWLKQRSLGMAQIYSTGLEYCFVSANNRQICPMVYCKDFLQDAIWAWHNKSSVKIYGFTYARKTGVPLCLRQTKIALSNATDEDFSNKIPAMLAFLNAYERKLKIMRTTAIEVSNPLSKYKSGVWLLQSSSRWMIAPPMLSLYSLLVRVGFNHRPNRKIETTVQRLLDGGDPPYQKNDKSYFNSAQNGIEYIIKYGYTRVFYRKPSDNYPGSINVDDMHNYTGIVTFSEKIKQNEERAKKKSVKPMMPLTHSPLCDSYAANVPYWYRNLSAEKKKVKE